MKIHIHIGIRNDLEFSTLIRSLSLIHHHKMGEFISNKILNIRFSTFSNAFVDNFSKFNIFQVFNFSKSLCVRVNLYRMMILLSGKRDYCQRNVQL